jgi:tetratricopeptide (TPR) repeat protein
VRAERRGLAGAELSCDGELGSCGGLRERAARRHVRLGRDVLAEAIGRKAKASDELPDELYWRLTALTEVGNRCCDAGRFQDALVHFEAAFDLLPEPKAAWNAALWTLASIGDCHFLLGDHQPARKRFLEAIALPGAVGNVFVHLRLGEIALGLGDEALAADELIRACAVGGVEAFEGDTAVATARAGALRRYRLWSRNEGRKKHHR